MGSPDGVANVHLFLGGDSHKAILEILRKQTQRKVGGERRGVDAVVATLERLGPRTSCTTSDSAARMVEEDAVESTRRGQGVSPTLPLVSPENKRKDASSKTRAVMACPLCSSEVLKRCRLI